MKTQLSQQYTNVALDPEEARTRLLARAYRLILSWPCPICKRPSPCPHDTEGEAARDTAHEKREKAAQVKVSCLASPADKGGSVCNEFQHRARETL